MRTRTLGLAAVALSAAALTGCVPIGPMTTATPEIEEATAVVLDVGGDLTITEGEPSLTIHAPSGVIEALTAEVRDGVLELGRRPGPMAFSGARISYELSLPTLERITIDGSGGVRSSVSSDSLAIEISGAGDVEFEGIDGDDVTVTIDGSGDVALDGAARSVSVEIDGSGDVDLDGLEVRDAEVAISGSGDVRLHVTDTLVASIEGSGAVRHRGGATVQSDISGSGVVSPTD